MQIPPAVVLLLVVAILGAAVALAGFVWAVATGQLDPTNAGANSIFEDGESGER